MRKLMEQLSQQVGLYSILMCAQTGGLSLNYIYTGPIYEIAKPFRHSNRSRRTFFSYMEAAPEERTGGVTEVTHGDVVEPKIYEPNVSGPSYSLKIASSAEQAQNLEKYKQYLEAARPSLTSTLYKEGVWRHFRFYPFRDPVKQNPSSVPKLNYSLKNYGPG